MSDDNGIEKPALVAGASGFVGSHIVRALVKAGRPVRVMVRPSSKIDAFADLPVEIVHGDALDPASIRAAMTGCSTVFWSVLDPRFWLSDPAPIYRNNVDTVVNGMDAALETGIDRFVFISTMGTLGINPDGPVDEDIPFNWADRAPPYIRARKQAEDRFIEYCRERNLPGVALCVANTYGPHDYGPTPHNGNLWEVACGRSGVVLDGAQPTVDIRDVADAALLAERRGRIGQRYIIANEFIAARDFYALAVAETGKPMPKILPHWFAQGFAWVAERIFKLIGKKDQLVSTDAVFLSGVFREMDHGKATRELGWSPRPIRETVRDAVRWFAAQEENKT